MDITIIHGQGHKGSTYHITSMIQELLADGDTKVHEYFMPQDTPAFVPAVFSVFKMEKNIVLKPIGCRK